MEVPLNQPHGPRAGPPSRLPNTQDEFLPRTEPHLGLKPSRAEPLGGKSSDVDGYGE